MGELSNYWLNMLDSDREAPIWWKRKKALCESRNAEVVKVNGNGRIYQRLQQHNRLLCSYLLHMRFLIKVADELYQEEQVLPYRFTLVNGKIEDHQEIVRQDETEIMLSDFSSELLKDEDSGSVRFSYDRLAAVQYAERWWNSYNPEYPKFEVDCTNFISQCLKAGGAPMWGAPNRARGWWYQNNNWSYSWSVAHSLRWYLSGSKQGLKGIELEYPDQLSPGDVICYDFQGDERWDHNTIVVAKDAYGMPLVNAHTDNSRHRYWSYEDSSAWTPNIQYKFFRIGES